MVIEHCRKDRDLLHCSSCLAFNIFPLSLCLSHFLSLSFSHVSPRSTVQYITLLLPLALYLSRFPLFSLSLTFPLTLYLTCFLSLSIFHVSQMLSFSFIFLFYIRSFHSHLSAHFNFCLFSLPLFCHFHLLQLP